MAGPMKRARTVSSGAGQKSLPKKKARKDDDSSEKTGTMKKRSAPVTVTWDHVVREEESDEEWGDEDDFLGGDVEVVDGDGDVEMKMENVNGEEQEQPKRSKDPEQLRQQRQDQKALLHSRRSQKAHSSTLTQAKPVWHQLIQKSNSPQDRKKYVGELMGIVRGSVKELCTKHDASRVVQSLVKYGGKSEREEVAGELEGVWGVLVRGRYSKFLVLKLLRLLPSHRLSILRSILPPDKPMEVQRLIVHKEASTVLADTFELYANARERAEMVRGFWGKEVALFSDNNTSDDSEGKKSLQSALDSMSDPTRRTRVLKEVAGILTAVFANEDRAASTHALVHRALWEYLSALSLEANVPDEAARESMRREMLEQCAECLPEMVHTRDGSRAVREFVVWGNAKDRKNILKTLKPHLPRMALNDEAQLVIFTVIDCLDDTKLLAKSLLPALSPLSSPPPPTTSSSALTKPQATTSTTDLHTTPQGRRAFLYPLLPRCTRHFPPALVRTIAETDPIVVKAGTSKKDGEVRRREVRDAVSPELVAWVEKRGGEILNGAGAGGGADNGGGGVLVVGEVMLYASGSKDRAVETLLSSIATPYPSPSPDKKHPIDNPPIARLFKTLLQGGHFSRALGSVDLVPINTWDHRAFARRFFSDSGPGRDTVVGMCTKGERGGAFVVAEGVEALLSSSSSYGSADEKGERKVVDEEVEETRERVKAWFGEDVKAEIGRGEGKGKGVLLEALGKL